MGIILIVMIGVGLAESSGLIGALIRKLVDISSSRSLTYIIVFVGIISSIASDAGYLVLIPLGAAAFMSVGRHPLAGMAAAFAGVAAGFGVNLLITPTDAVLTEITNESIALVDPRPIHRHHRQPVVRDRVDDHAHHRHGAHLHAHHRTPAGRLRPLPGSRQRHGRSRRRSRRDDLPGPRVKGPALVGPGHPGRDRGDRASHLHPGGAPARPRDGQHHRYVALHGQPDRHHRHRVSGRRRVSTGRSRGPSRTPPRASI